MKYNNYSYLIMLFHHLNNFHNFQTKKNLFVFEFSHKFFFQIQFLFIEHSIHVLKEEQSFSNEHFIVIKINNRIFFIYF